MENKNRLKHLVRDIFIIAGSIIVATVLGKSGAIQILLGISNDWAIVSSLIAGAFFTSIFSIAPAAIGLMAISETSSPLLVATFGAIGAMTVDIIIASFVRKDLSQDFESIKRFSLKWHFISLFHFGFLKWLAFGLGLVVIASPLPDELGLFFIGISKVKAKYLPLLFFIANFAGIYALISISRALS